MSQKVVILSSGLFGEPEPTYLDYAKNLKVGLERLDVGGIVIINNIPTTLDADVVIILNRSLLAVARHYRSRNQNLKAILFTKYYREEDRVGGIEPVSREAPDCFRIIAELIKGVAAK